MENEYEDETDYFRCDRCGIKGEEVCLRLNPYILEMTGEKETEFLCDYCAYELAMEV